MSIISLVRLSWDEALMGPHSIILFLQHFGKPDHFNPVVYPLLVDTLLYTIDGKQVATQAQGLVVQILIPRSLRQKYHNPQNQFLLIHSGTIQTCRSPSSQPISH